MFIFPPLSSVNPFQRWRFQALRFTFGVALFASVLAFGSYAYVYFREGIWQVGAAGLLVFAAVLCLLPVWSALRIRNLDAAGIWLIVVLMLAYTGDILFLEGLTVYILPAVLIFTLFAGSIIIPNRWRIWLMLMGIFTLYALWIEFIQPFPRYPAAQNEILNTSNGGTIALLSIIGFLHLVLVLKFGSLRARLSMAFLSVVLLTVIAIGSVTAIVGFDNGSAQALDQLNSVASIKRAALLDWLATLHTSLTLGLPATDTEWRLDVLLSGENQPESIKQIVYQRVSKRLQQVMAQTGLFEEIFLLDTRGIVVLSTNPSREGTSYSGDYLYISGLTQRYNSPPRYFEEVQGLSLVISQPLINTSGQTMGILAARARMDSLNRIMVERSGLGFTGETYLVNSTYALVTPSRFDVPILETFVRTEGTLSTVDRRQDGSGRYVNYRGREVFGVYQWIPQLQVALLAEKDRDEALQSTVRSLVIILGTAGGVSALALAAAFWLTTSLANPLSQLSEIATRFASGNYTQRASIVSHDEIGSLAASFNQMADQITRTLGDLEARVAERTLDVERRSAQLQAAADVATAITTIRNLEDLLPQLARLIAERFNFYHVGIFLIDEDGQYAVLRASNSEGDQQMLARNHRLQIGQQGIVGYVTAERKPRIALDVGEDATFFNNPDLPETHSEMALPLLVGDELLGALDVQSVETNAFSQQDVQTLQVLANEVAIAIYNARLIQQTQELLEAERLNYGEVSRVAWQKQIKALGLQGLRRVAGSHTTEIEWEPEMQRVVMERTAWVAPEDPRLLYVPIVVRDIVIGVLRLRKPISASRWLNSEINVMRSLSEQLGIALESARIYQETRLNAQRNRILSDVTGRVRENIEVESILRTLVTEIRTALNLPEVTMQFSPEFSVPQPAIGTANSLQERTV